MADREIVLSNIRKALEGIQRTPRPEIDWDQITATSRLDTSALWESFQENFAGVRGKFCTRIEELAAFLKAQDCRRGYCDPALKQAVGLPLSESVEIVYEYGRDQIDALQFGITRGSAVIAETGTIILKDCDTVNRLAALAPWVHIAAVAQDHIYPGVRDAILEFDDDPNIVWVTGPSKTADVEGILIEGVHGPGEQVCMRLDF